MEIRKMQTQDLGLGSLVRFFRAGVLVVFFILCFPAARVQAAQDLVNINTADLSELDALPGIGPVLGQRIIDDRPYRSVSELQRIHGLTRTTYERIKPLVTTGTTVPAGTAKPGNAEANPKAAPGGVLKTGEKAPAKNVVSPGSTSARLLPGEKINLNKAAASELEKLPGIGPTKAQAIVAYRQAHGDFKTIAEVMNVKGIKEGTFSKIREYLVVKE
jgi:competence protein ComEA